MSDPKRVVDLEKSSAVMTDAEEMVRIVRRAGRAGYWVQSWRRVPGRTTAWICREQRVRLTHARALALALSWPGPVTIEPHHIREVSAR